MSEETNVLNVGALRSQMTLQIHTKQAARLWHGRKPDKGKHGIWGLSQFLYLTNQINLGSRLDDPYSDWFMLRVEKKITETQVNLGRLRYQVQSVFSNIPKTLTITENLNQAPAELPVFAGSHMGYQAIYLLAQYDDVAKNIALALHMALIDLYEAKNWLNQGDHYLRSLFTLTQRYRFSNINRTDLMEQNEKAKVAVEKYGAVPPDILDGTRRSRFSPPLFNRELHIGGEDSAGDKELNDSGIDIFVPAESELEDVLQQSGQDEDDRHAEGK